FPHHAVLPGLLKPFPSARAAGGEEQIPISVEQLDGRTVSVVVGISEMYRGSDYPVVGKGAVLVIAVPSIPERVILCAWLALPGAILVSVRNATCISCHGAVEVKCHKRWKWRALLVGIITVDPVSGYLPHAHDGGACFWRQLLVRAPDR